MNIIQKKFKEAREFLGISKNAAAQKAGLTHTAVNQFEKGKSNRANFDYATYLIKEGINPYFLIGESDQIEGKSLDDIIDKSEYEKLKTEFELLQSKYDTLQEMMKGLKIEMDEEGNLRKQK